MTTQTATVAALPIISDEKEDVILSALRTLHGAVALYGKPLPTFEEMSGDTAQMERITTRAHRSLNALHSHRREEKVRAFRQGVKDAVLPYIQEQGTARDTFLALPKEVRQFMPAFPTNVYIPIDAVSDVFAPGTTVDAQVKMLHTMGYKVSKKDSKSYIVAELPAAAK